MLSSSTEENNRAFEHTLRLAVLNNQGTGQCDRIEVIDWVFTVDKISGQIAKIIDSCISSKRVSSRVGRKNVSTRKR